MKPAGVLDKSPGTYVLILEAQEPALIQAGRLGELDITSGWYAYVGSAFGPGGVAARCGHHMQISQRPHWHIDYLRVVCELREIWFSYDSARVEHTWSDLVGRGRGATRPFPGFGASDCGCQSHLYHFSRTPSFLGFKRRLYSFLPGLSPLRRIILEGY
jgi:Uri superfamily endonuclease